MFNIINQDNKPVVQVSPISYDKHPSFLTHKETEKQMNSSLHENTEDFIDLNKELIRNPVYTFYGRVTGEKKAKPPGINNGDILIIDKLIEPEEGNIVVCCIESEFVLKIYRRKRNTVWLLPVNDRSEPVQLTGNSDITIWGIVTYSIKSHYP